MYQNKNKPIKSKSNTINKMQQPQIYTCQKCSGNIAFHNADYHDQYECQRRIKFYQQQKYNQQLNPEQKPSQRQLIGSIKSQKYKKPIKSKHPKQQKMESIKDIIPFIKKTDSTIYKDFNEEQKKEQFLQDMEQKIKHKKSSNNNEPKVAWREQQPAAQIKRSNVRSAAAVSRVQSFDDKVQCVNCKQKISLQQIDEHEFSCGYQIECEFCGLTLAIVDVERHQKKCEVKKLWEQQNSSKIAEQYYKPKSTLSYIQNKYGYQQYDFKHDPVQDLKNIYDYDNYQANHADESNQFQEQNIQWESKIKKHKGLTNSKLGNLHFTSYRKKSISKKEKSSEIQPNQDQEEPCSICYLSFQESQTIIKLPCLHTYHPECVGKWLETDDRCPMCKVKVQ